MARAKKAAEGSATVNITGLTFKPCESFEFDDEGHTGFIQIVDDKGTIYLPKASTIVGNDANGSWYASALAVREESISVVKAATDAHGNVVVSGVEEEDGSGEFIFVPAAMMGRLTIAGEPEFETEESGAAEPVAEEVPETRTRVRGRGR
jgi:hypothetical protein